MNKKQAVNPFLPSYEYIPDAEPRVFGDRVYIYGSHDKFNGISFCLNDYVCYSAPINDLADWRYEGVIFKKAQDPSFNIGFLNSMFAPDCIKGNDGKFYLYYFIGYKGCISVAVCDTPAGQFEYLGKVKYSDGKPLGKKGEPLQFDPGIFVDDDGRVFLYSGFAPLSFPSLIFGGKKPTREGAMVFELESDMLTIKSPLKYIAKVKRNGKGTDFEGHEFFEAASMRKFDDKYYFIYSSHNGHELCYAVSDSPDKDFKFGGVLVSNGDIGVSEKAKNYTGNTHGSIAKINDDYYIFYHRQTNGHQFSRQASAEKLTFKDGKFYQAELTSCGLNGGALNGIGEYAASIACNLYSKEGTFFYGISKKGGGIHPYFTQSGKDRNDNPDQFIANFCDGAVVGFKYFDMQNPSQISIKIKGKAKGIVEVSTSEGESPIAKINIDSCKRIQTFSSTLKQVDGKNALFFKFHGKGHFDFISFEIK